MQSLLHSASVSAIANNDEEWGDEMKAKRRNYWKAWLVNAVELTSEHFLLKESCSSLAAACLHLESDAFTAAIAFDELEKLRHHLFYSAGMALFPSLTYMKNN